MSELQIIRVLSVDDHELLRRGIRFSLLSFDDLELVGEAANGEEALAMCVETNPDVVLMDLVMPEMDGIEAIRQIKLQNPEIRILVLTTFAGEDKIFPAIKAGALGYHLKDSGPKELLDAIRQVHRGESSLHPIIARKVLDELTRPAEKLATPDLLTRREVEVLRLVAQGLENPEIANQLVISKATVRTHVSNIMSKLHLASRTQAALYALREGLASLDDDEKSSAS